MADNECPHRFAEADAVEEEQQRYCRKDLG
jgi:hypothetical protein